MARAPLGMRLLGVCAACFSLLTLGLLLSDEPSDTPRAVSALANGALTLLVVLGAITAEALWCARRWAFRAAVLLAVSFAATLLAGPLFFSYGESLQEALLVVTLSGLLIVPALYYVHATLPPTGAGRRRPPLPPRTP